MRRQDPHLPRLVAAATLVSTAFGALAYAVATRRTRRVDRAINARATPRKDDPVRVAAASIFMLGKWYTYIPISAALAALLLQRGVRRRGAPLAVLRGVRSERVVRRERAGALAVVASSALAYGIGKAMDEWLPQPPPPPGQEKRNKPVFPSGHAFGTAAVGLTAAYVFTREGYANGFIVFPIASALPLVTSGSRFIDDKHWASDVVGGCLGGLAVACWCAAAYESVGFAD